jgi:type IV secretory pathway VirB4 component
LKGLPDSEKELRIHEAVNIQLKEILVLIRGMVGSQSYLSVLDELNASVLDKYAKIMES